MILWENHCAEKLYWHMNCDSVVNHVRVANAMNAKLIKVLRDIRDLNSTPLRRGHPKPTILYLMELRSHAGHDGFSRRQIVIPIQMKNGSTTTPFEIKIKHVV